MATIELRCDHELYGRLTDERWLEVKCRRRACGFTKGSILLHTIDLKTGKVVATRQFANPTNIRKE